MAKTIILEARHIRQLLRDPKIASEFPFLVQTAGTMAVNGAKGARGCKPCGQMKAAGADRQAINRVKQSIASMSPTNRDKLKAMLQTESIQLVYRSEGTGKLLKLTF